MFPLLLSTGQEYSESGREQKACQHRTEHHAQMRVWIVEAEWKHQYSTSSRPITPAEHCFSVTLTILTRVQS